MLRVTRKETSNRSFCLGLVKSLQKEVKGRLGVLAMNSDRKPSSADLLAFTWQRRGRSRKGKRKREEEEEDEKEKKEEGEGRWRSRRRKSKQPKSTERQWTARGK